MLDIRGDYVYLFSEYTLFQESPSEKFRIEKTNMTFIYAEELKSRFNVYGHFYNLRLGKKVLNCRSTLDIVAAGSDDYETMLPDAVVVMMNPGSSRPINRNYVPKSYSADEMFMRQWKKESVPTRPDNAQYQIMRVMILRGWKYVKVLNLSDLRNGNSGKFGEDFANASLLDGTHPHCITHKKRRRELLDALRTKLDGPIIAAWGSIQVLRESADAMLGCIPQIIGVRPDSTLPWFRYASPYMKRQKVEWVRNILTAIEGCEDRSRISKT